MLKIDYINLYVIFILLFILIFNLFLHDFNLFCISNSKIISMKLSDIYNLKKIYPSKHIVTWSLIESQKKLIKIKDDVVIVTPQKLWGTNNWRKMSYRMSFAESVQVNLL